MRNAIVIVIGALSLTACAKDKQAEDVTGTTTTRGATEQKSYASPDEIRTVLHERHPNATDEINGLLIRSDDGIVTLRGRLDNEQMKSDILNRVRSLPNVKSVRDEIAVMPKQRTGSADAYGTTTTTGAQQGAGAHQGQTRSEVVRKSLEKALPRHESILRTVGITEDGETIRLTGTVPDEATRKAIVKAAKDTPGVHDVEDELKVQPPKK